MCWSTNVTLMLLAAKNFLEVSFFYHVLYE